MSRSASTTITITTASRDLFSLSDAPLETLLETLLEEQSLADRGGVAPPRAEQIADLILSAVIRLIRLGTPGQLADAGVEVSRRLVGSAAEELERCHPRAYRVLAAASLVLGAAAAPSSGGGEVAVLRAWNGLALEAFAAVSRAPGQAMARSELRCELGHIDESHLSHILADLEDAGLVARIRDGRNVTVHLGPLGHEKHVRELLPKQPAGFAIYQDTMVMVSDQFEVGGLITNHFDKYDRSLQGEEESVVARNSAPGAPGVSPSYDFDVAELDWTPMIDKLASASRLSDPVG
jgi:DNA-binding transcriptional ArsR family regulator